MGLAVFPSAPLLLGFLATAITIIVIPGPSVMFVIGRTLSHGRRAGLLTVVFNSFGTFVWLLAVALGLGGFLASIPAALNVIRLAGAVYLGYLGVQSFRHRTTDEAAMLKREQDAAADTSMASNRKMAREAFFIGLSNPKVAVFFFAVLPQFIEPGANAFAQMLTLGLLFEIIGVASDSVYALGAAAARGWIFGRTGRVASIVGTGGVLIVGLALWLIASTVAELFGQRLFG
jgi:threonine/homoserine/homoserine lactone efflux protein